MTQLTPQSPFDQIRQVDPTGAVQCVSTRYKGVEECIPNEIDALEFFSICCIEYLNGDRASMQLNLLDGGAA